MTQMPEELQKIIQDYARPIWTRPDWRTCKHFEAEQMSLVHYYFGPGNPLLRLGWGDIYDNWTFYDYIKFGFPLPLHNTYNIRELMPSGSLRAPSI